MEKQFNKQDITQDIKNSLIDLIHLRLTKSILEEKEKEQANILLNNQVFYGSRPKIGSDGRFERDDERNVIYEKYQVLDVNETDNIYRYSENEFKKFNSLHSKELENIGIYTITPDIGASLVVHTLESKEELKLINLLTPITGVKLEQIFNFNKRKEYIELCEKLIISVMDENDILQLKKNILETKSFLDYENKVRFDTNFEKNDKLKDFSKNIEDLINEEKGEIEIKENKKILNAIKNNSENEWEQFLEEGDFWVSIDSEKHKLGIFCHVLVDEENENLFEITGYKNILDEDNVLTSDYSKTLFKFYIDSKENILEESCANVELDEAKNLVEEHQKKLKNDLALKQ